MSVIYCYNKYVLGMIIDDADLEWRRACEKTEAAHSAIAAAAEMEAEESDKGNLKVEAEDKGKVEAEESEKGKDPEEAEDKGKVEAEDKGKVEAEAKGKEEAEDKGKVEAEAKGKVEAEDKGKVEAEAEAMDKEELEAEDKEEAEDKGKVEAEAKKVEKAEDKEVWDTTKTKYGQTRGFVRSDLQEAMQNIPHIHGLDMALAANAYKSFVWSFGGASDVITDEQIDSTDVEVLGALVSAKSYFMHLPDRMTRGDRVDPKHQQMSKAVQKLFVLVGPHAEKADLDYCEFTCLPAGMGSRGSEWRGDNLTFINCSDSKLTVRVRNKNIADTDDDEEVFDCGPWSMFTVDGTLPDAPDARKRFLVGPVKEAQLYIVLGHTKGDGTYSASRGGPPSNPKSALFKQSSSAKADKTKPRKPRAKRGGPEDLKVDSGDASNIEANKDAKMNGAGMRWLKDHFGGPQSKQAAYLGVKNAEPEVPVHNKLGKSLMLQRDEYDLGFAYRDAGKMHTDAARNLLLNIVRAHPGSAMNWAHDKILQKGMVKHIIHIEGWEPQPALHGKDEAISDAEHATRRKKVINITDPTLAEALSKYVTAMRALIPAELLAMVDNPDKTYDLTVNFSTLPQPQHHDDQDHDGCSGLIFNHYLQKSAMVMFAQNLDWDKVWHRWIEVANAYMFCRFLRLQCNHGVYPQYALNDKGNIPKHLTVKQATLGGCKMTTTLRIGDCKQEDIDGHVAMLAALKADSDEAAKDKEEEEEDAKDFTTPRPRTKKPKQTGKEAKAAAAEEEEEEELVPVNESVPHGWSTSGTVASFRENQWVRHEKVWRDLHPKLVLQSGVTFALGSDFTQCDVAVLAIGVFHQALTGAAAKKRVTALCSIKKDGNSTWDNPVFHSASAIIDCVVTSGLEFATLKEPKPFSEQQVAELCEEQSGRDIKSSCGFWSELQITTSISPKSSKRTRSGSQELEPTKLSKNAKVTAAAAVVAATKVP
jgi:uncharacterized protein YbdZ (MbtH family)